MTISELADYFSADNVNSLTVYTDRDERLKINFRISFVSLPCSYVNVDFMDKLGEEHVAVSKNIDKKSWRGNWNEEIAKYGLLGMENNNYNSQLRTWKSLIKTFPKSNAGRASGCVSCYEASRVATCCNSCRELQLAYTRSGLDIKKTYELPQCKDEEEGCLLSGSVEVNKVQGQFHIAVGSSHTEHGQRHHHHWNAEERGIGFNTTHYIHHLSFGEEVPGLLNPLDGKFHLEEGVSQQQYFLQIVPTDYVSSSGYTISTNQYSVAELYTPIDTSDPNRIALPGVFFKYDIAAMKVNIQEHGITFSHLITRLFAVIGGVYVVLGLVYSSVRSIVENVVKLLK